MTVVILQSVVTERSIKIIMKTDQPSLRKEKSQVQYCRADAVAMLEYSNRVVILLVCGS